jgi:ring-1,2-phenylacetyl-CoA epoxidase subunit PaaC
MDHVAEFELRAWADDEFIVGHILGSRIIEYTHLEECLAIGSFAQDEMAHARALYEYTGLRDRALDRYVFFRAADEFVVTPLATYQPADFPELVVKQYLYEVLDRLRLQAISERSGRQLQEILPVMRYEEHVHSEHWRRWLQVLATSPARPRLEQALQVVGRYCGLLPWQPSAQVQTWYGHWRPQVEQELAEQGLTLGAAASVDWQQPFAALIEHMQSVFRERPEVRLG